jgi:hypothetical protein
LVLIQLSVVLLLVYPLSKTKAVGTEKPTGKSHGVCEQCSLWVCSQPLVSGQC